MISLSIINIALQIVVTLLIILGITFFMIRRNWLPTINHEKNDDTVQKEKKNINEINIDSLSEHGDFLNVLVHEIRPLTNLLYGYSFMLSGTELNSQQKEMLSSIQLLVKKIEKTMDDSLSAGTIIAQKESFDITQKLIEVINSLSLAMMESRIRIELQNPNSQINVRGNPVIYENLIRNLLENTLKYSKPGTTVNISIKNFGDRASLYLASSGIGMSIVKDIISQISRSKVEFMRSQSGDTVYFRTLSDLIIKEGLTIKSKADEEKSIITVVDIPIMN